MYQRKEEPKKYCQYCGKKLERKRYNGRLEDFGVFLRRKYCNRECARASSYKEHPTKSALLKRATLLRGTKCEICGAMENLDIHHIDGNPANNKASNLMTLCDSCHTRWHWQNGKKRLKKQSACKICGELARKLGMCGKHYQRFKKYGNPYLTKIRHGSHFVLVDERHGLPH